MNIAVVIAAHLATVVLTATISSAAYGLVSVYLLGNVDPKFGAAGTVQLLALIAVLCSSLAAVGSGLFLWMRRSTLNQTALAIGSGLLVGAIVCATHKLLLFNAPLVPGITDWPQQCAYFLALGFVSHWIAATVISKVVRASAR